MVYSQDRYHPAAVSKVVTKHCSEFCLMGEGVCLGFPVSKVGLVKICLCVVLPIGLFHEWNEMSHSSQL